MQANREYLMQLNPSEEIAKYIHLQMMMQGGDTASAGVDKVKEKLSVVLMYNLDK